MKKMEGKKGPNKSEHEHQLQWTVMFSAVYLKIRVCFEYVCVQAMSGKNESCELPAKSCVFKQVHTFPVHFMGLGIFLCIWKNFMAAWETLLFYTW